MHARSCQGMLLAVSLLWTPAMHAQQNQQRQQDRLQPTHADVRYGEHERNVLDLYLAKSDKPTPLVLYIHGGGFRGGDKRTLNVRAAFLHVGAMLGTLMTANVRERIIPAQLAMVNAIREGRPPDLTLGRRAKERSKHNTFMVVPLVLIMLSSHFPTITFGHRHAWAMLGGLTLVGWAAAWVYRKH